MKTPELPKLYPLSPEVAGWKLVDQDYRNVGNGHTVYHEAWEGPEAENDTPWTIHQHGGPGQGFNLSHQMVHAPNNRVVFHDQRGAGRSHNDNSEDRFNLESNTTSHLIADINSLVDHMGADQVNLVGGSWGSGLSLMYGMRHPERVKDMMLWGIYTGRPEDYDLSINEVARSFAPTEFERLVQTMPNGETASYAEIAGHLLDQVMKVDETTLKPTDEARSAAVALGLYQFKLAEPVEPIDEATKATYELINSGFVPLLSGPQLYDAYLEQQPDANIMGEAAIPLHYFTNGTFMTPDIDIFENASALKGKTIHLINGAQDLNTPPSTAKRVHEALMASGASSSLEIVEGAGHIRTDKKLLAALLAKSVSIG